MSTYYNEFEPYAAEWLRNLIKEGQIPDGEVDTRSILDVAPDDLRGFVQCHFFAGIGGWAYAARLAGWPDDRPLWTGSAPCQPFSSAGKQKGQADERHLWPVFFGLIRACRPPVVMGEQVAAAVGKDWLDGVSSDLEGIGYACGAVVVPACAVDAPHRRDRLWFVADCERIGLRGERSGALDGAQAGVQGAARQRERVWPDLGADGLLGGGGWDVADANIGQSRAKRGDDGEMRRVQEAQRRAEHGAAVSGKGGREDGALADAGQVGRDGRPSPAGCETGSNAGSEGRSSALALADASSGRRGEPGEGQDQLARGAEAVGTGRGDVDDAISAGLEGLTGHGNDCSGRAREAGSAPATGGSVWSRYAWAIGADGKARRVEPSIRLLAHGVPARVGRLRAYGNAIVPALASEIIAAYMEA